MTKAEMELLKEAALTWLTLIANDPETLGEALDITLSAGEILGIEQEEMNEIIDRG